MFGLARLTGDSDLLLLEEGVDNRTLPDIRVSYHPDFQNVLLSSFDVFPQAFDGLD